MKSSDYRKLFENMNDHELVDYFNKQIEQFQLFENTTEFSFAMENEFIKRKIDFSKAKDKYLMLRNVKLRLDNREVIPVSIIKPDEAQ